MKRGVMLAKIQVGFAILVLILAAILRYLRLFLQAASDVARGESMSNVETKWTRLNED